MKVCIVRLIAALLVICFTVLPLASCSDDGTEKAETTAAASSVENTWKKDSLPEGLDYSGETVRIFSRRDGWYYDELTLESNEVANIINESVYDREAFVEDRLGFDIRVQKENVGTDYGKLERMARTYFESDIDAFDIIAGHSYFSLPLSTDGMIYDLREVDNVELSEPWYAQNFIELSTLNDKTFFVAGDATLSMTRFVFVTFVNLDIASNYGINDIYSVVDNKEWTSDYLASVVAGVHDDLNSSGSADAGDLFGLGVTTATGIDLFCSSYDLKIINKNDEGVLDIAMDGDKCSAAVDKIRDLYYNNPGTYVDMAGYESMMESFSSDEYLFTNLRLVSVEDGSYINMESDYGIIPTPMWDGDQENYQSFVHDEYTVMGIMGTAKEERLSMLGAFLEAFSNYSYNETREVYFELALKGRYARDEASRRMLDLIIDSIYLDAGWIFSGCLGDFALIFREIVPNRNLNWTSFYRSKLSIVKKYVTDLNEAYQ